MRDSVARRLAWIPLALAGCGDEPAPALRIGTNVWTGCEPLYLARDLGHLDPEAIRLVEYPSASEVQRAFRNQTIDGMVISLDEVLTLAQDDFRPRIVLVIDISHGGDAIVGRPELRTVKDLVGKRVAVESGVLGAYVLSRALAHNGMRQSDVKIVYQEADEHVAAYQQGLVDAVVTFNPVRAELLRGGASLLFDSTRIPGEIVDLVAVRATALEDDPKAVKALVAGWFRALDYLEHNPRDAASRMGARQQMTGEQFLESLEGLRFPSREDNVTLLGGEEPGLAESGARLMALMREAKLIRGPVNIEALLAPGPLASLSP